MPQFEYKTYTWGNVIEHIEDSRFGESTGYFRVDSGEVHKIKVKFLGFSKGYEIELNDVDLGGDFNLGEAWDILKKCVVSEEEL